MRLFAFVVLAALLLAAPAGAHFDPRSRTHNIRHVMVGVWGAKVCGDTMRIPIQRVKLKDGIAGLGYPCQARFPRGLIQIDDRSWSTDELCRILGHETGHVAGWTAPRGQEHVAADGSVEPWHSNRRLSVMSTPLIPYWRPCARFR